MPRLERLAWPDGDAPDLAGAERHLRAAGMEPMSWSNAPLDRYSGHTHAYEKELYCVAGSIDFLVGDERETVTLSAGDGLRLPAGTWHAATVGPEGCTCVEGHAPASG